MTYFYCYSYPLKEFLISRMQKMIISSVHSKTNKRVWLFERNDELNKYLDEWRLRKP